MKRALVSIAGLLLLHGCSTPVTEIGRPPSFSDIDSSAGSEGLGPDFFPKPPPKPVHRYSLWDDKRSNLFTDRRALADGDILTVLIEIQDKARLRNQSDRSRDASKSIGLSAEYDISGIGANAGSAFASGDSSTDFEGSGSTIRSETISLSVAAMVTAVLPNGNLIIRGSQEVRVNSELRILNIAGIVRPTDIGPDNTVSYERIAEARISYGGRGRISEVQEPPYGQQILDKFLPF
ncbi:MAG: flagellar basal body L-ring protein FlgH [Rhizobiaceae bacterium]